MRYALVAVLVAFTAFTTWVLIRTGTYLGFVHLALAEPWGGQMFVDLCIALGIAGVWLIRDAWRLRISPWPWVALILTLGSIGLLGYLIRRDLREPLFGPPAGQP